MENGKSENISNVVVDLLNRNFELADIRDYLLQKGYLEDEIAAALEKQQIAREKRFPGSRVKYSYSKTALYFFTGVLAIITGILLVRDYNALLIDILGVIVLLVGIYRIARLFFDYPDERR